MAKKKRKQDLVLELENNEPVVFEEEQQSQPQQPLMFESEAYDSMQREAGSDVTVVKQIGIGGPVPIVAPKQTTIQLQPIVVPLAVVPYMSQDSGVLRTDRPQSFADEYVEATEFSQEQAQEKKKGKKKASPRWFALSSFVVSAVLVLPFILAYFFSRIGLLYFDGLDRFNVIGIVIGWITSKEFGPDLYRSILFLVSALAVAVMVVVMLFALIAGKYPRVFSVVASLLAAGPLVAVLVIDIVKGVFVVNDRVALVVCVALGALSLLLSIIFSVAASRAENKEERQKYNSEI